MKQSQKKLILFLCFFNYISAENNPTEFVTIAILAKDKAHTLPLYLSCIENQTWPKSQTNLYIRTNNNNDHTAQVLRDWIGRIGNEYAKIYFDNTDIDEPIEQFAQHEWNCTRFKVLGKIRQESIDWAYNNNSHYFVADCDNFVCPDTIEQMLNTRLPIVAPMLHCLTNTIYSNYHFAIDENGYWGPGQMYYTILNQEVRGLIEVPVIHCTYLIRHEVLNQLTYDDESYRYEYVIFSHSARKKNIPQYLDNRKIYGYITFAENSEEFAQQEPLMNKYLLPINKLCSNASYYVLDPVEEVFTRIYKAAINEWFSQETVSGIGSELKVTHTMRQELSALIKRLQITSIADAPCGDLNWMQYVDIGTCRYIGIDIVQELIEKNVKVFGATREFRYLNLIENIIEKVDLIICRDMLAHLTYEQIFTVLKNFKQSGSKYILVTTGVTTQSNFDIEGSGGWRTLNLELSPFNFPKPLALIKEDVPFQAEYGKHLGLWFLEDIEV